MTKRKKTGMGPARGKECALAISRMYFQGKFTPEELAFGYMLFVSAYMLFVSALVFAKEHP